MSDQLWVWQAERRVGELYLGADGRSIGLRYQPDWQLHGTAISQSLPLQHQDFSPDDGRAHLWFGNLLPEEGSRAALVRRLGVADDDFALLRALGGDCAGALRLLRPEAPTAQAGAGLREADPQQLAAWAAGRERYALIQATAGEATRLSLAGAQDKIPVVLESPTRIFVPEGDTPSSHILKFADRAGLIFNELCMNTLAARVGLPTPHTEVLRVQQQPILAVQRYDRELREGERVRVHQEDFCQALGLPRSRKYQADRGPNLADCADLIRRSTVAPARAIQQLMRWQMFNVLAGNSDGHGKNLSLLQRPDGLWQLSPCYDLVCTRVLPFDPHLAFAVGEQFNPQQLIRRDWEAMAEQLGVSPPFLLKQLAALAEQLHREVASPEYLAVLQHRGLRAEEWEQMQHLRRYLRQQCSKTLKWLGSRAQ